MKNSLIILLGAVYLSFVAVIPMARAEGEVVKAQAVAEDIDSDPSSFEGDSGSLPGERAPEDLPMDDTPAEGGMEVH